MSKVKCDYYECDVKKPLIVVIQVNGYDIGVCAKHAKIIEDYGVEFIIGGKEVKVYSPAYIDGYV